MGVEGCTKCIKYMLFFFNFIFWLAGCVILGVSLWLRHDEKTSSLMGLKFEDAEAPNTFYISVYILIAVGAVMMFVGFLGCYGAIQESQCLLGTFFACLVILFACEVAAGILGYIHKDKVYKEMIGFYDTVHQRGMALQGEKKEAAAAILKVFHETLQCCGKTGWDGTLAVFTSKDDLCPKREGQWIKQGCHSKIKELFSEKVYLIGIAALVVAVIL
ncbi:CD81 antigen, partial [Clarias magur]